MAAIQVVSGDCADEELTTISIRSSIGHRQNTGACVLQNEVLVIKFLTENRSSTPSIAVGEIASLDHEVGDDSMENAPLVSVPLGGSIAKSLWKISKKSFFK